MSEADTKAIEEAAQRAVALMRFADEMLPPVLRDEVHYAAGRYLGRMIVPEKPKPPAPPAPPRRGRPPKARSGGRWREYWATKFDPEGA